MKKQAVFIFCIVFFIIGIGFGYLFRGEHIQFKTQTVFKPLPTISLAPLLPILPPSIVTSSTPDDVVQTYYSWYLGCTRQHIASRTSPSLLYDCPFTTTGAVRSPFVNTLQTVGGKDPVLCSTETPPSLTFEPAIFQGTEKATVVVHGIYNKTATNTKIHVGIQKDTDNNWKITSISCQ